MSMHTAATSPRLANNPYPDQPNPSHAAEGSTPPELADQPTTPPVVSQVSRPAPQFSATVVGRQIASGTTLTNTQAVTTTTTTNTTTTTTTTTTTGPTYSNRKSLTRDPSAGRPDSVRQMLQLKNAGISLLHDAILRGDYTYALQLMDDGDCPCSNFLPFQTKTASRNPAVTRLVFAGKQGVGSPDLQPIISAFAVQVLLQCPTQTQTFNNARTQVNQINYYGANALTLAITSGAPIDFIKALCEKAVKNDPQFINRCDGAGRTALCMAAENGDLDLINVLMTNGAKLEAADWRRYHHAPMHAARRNDTKTLFALVSHLSTSDIHRHVLRAAVNQLAPDIRPATLHALHVKFPALSEELSERAKYCLEYAESFEPVWKHVKSIFTGDQLMGLIAHCRDPERLEPMLETIDPQLLVAHIRELRSRWAPAAVYDILAQRDPVFQALLAQSTFSQADIAELSRELNMARLSAATDWVEKLIRIGAVPETNTSCGDKEIFRVIAYMADIDSENYEDCYVSFSYFYSADENAFSELLKKTRTTAGLERILGAINAAEISLLDDKDLLMHAISLNSITAVESLTMGHLFEIDGDLLELPMSEEMLKLLLVLIEPPRVFRRLQPLREWSHEQVKQVFPRNARTGRANGA